MRKRYYPYPKNWDKRHANALDRLVLGVSPKQTRLLIELGKMPYLTWQQLEGNFLEILEEQEEILRKEEIQKAESWLL